MFILTPLHGKGTLALHHAQGNLGAITMHPRILGNNVTVRPSDRPLTACKPRSHFQGRSENSSGGTQNFPKPRWPPPPPPQSLPPNIQSQLSALVTSMIRSLIVFTFQPVLQALYLILRSAIQECDTVIQLGSHKSVH